MKDRVNVQTESSRIEIDAFDKEFARLHARSRTLIEATPADILYRGSPPTAAARSALSVGEKVVRSAAAVEQTFGGITANLWDNPFEWTLPENLSTPERVIEYLEEVEATRRRAFDRFSQDSDLLKQILVPSGETQPLITVLVATLARAADFQGRAEATWELMSDVRAGCTS
jgi:hypothetical protein